MKIQVQVGKVWRDAEATIDASGHAHVHLPHPYGERIFKTWRTAKVKRNEKKPRGSKMKPNGEGGE